MAELKNVRLQAGLGTEVTRKYKSQSNINTISLGRVTRINYRFNTVDFLLVSGGGTALLNTANDDGSYSAKLPVTFGGRNGYGKAYGTIHPVHINDIVLVGFIDGKKSNAIVLNSYVDNAVGLELSKTNNDQIDPADPSQVIDADQTYVVYPDLTYERHDGRGNLELSFNGKSFMVVDSDDYSGGTTLSDDGDALMDYKHLKGSYYHNNEMLEPVNGRAPRILMKHQGVDLPDGSVDNHAFYLNLSPDGTFRISQMQTNEDWRTYFEQTADGKIHMRRQNDSKVFGAGDITADMGIDENGYVFLRSGDTELQLRPDGIYNAGNNNLTGGINPDFESNVNKAIGNMITKDTFNTVMAQNIKAVQDLIDTTTAEQASVDKSLTSILNDSVVSPNEKTLLKQFLDKIDTDYTANTALALANNVDTASYDADYTALHKILEPILEHMDEDSKVDKNVVKTDFDVYYHDCLTLLSDVLKAIQDKSKDSFTDALSAGDAIENANKLLQDALDALSSIDFDNLTAADSSKIKQLWENANSNHDSIKSLLGQTTLDTTAFDAAYSVLAGLFDGVDFTKPLTIDLTGLKQDFTDYYNAAAALLKLFGGNALETIKNLQGDMEHLQSSINQSEKNINLNVNAIEKQGKTLTVQAADINVLKDSVTSTVSKTTIQNLINQGAGALLMGPKNLFVELTATLDKYIQTDGSLANVNGSRVSVFIPVASKEQYLLTIVCMTQTKAAYAFYDSAQGYVANSYTDLTNPTDFTFPQITIPDGVSFIRVSVSNSDAKVMLESGTYLTEWVPSYADRKASVSAAQAYASVMADLAANVQNSLTNANSIQNSMLSILSSFGTSVDPADKGDLKSFVDGINSRLTDDVGLAATFGVDTTVYQGYAKQLTDALSKYLTDMTSTEDFDYDALGTILKQYAAYRVTTLTSTNDVAQQANIQAKTDADQITQSVANAISDSAASTKQDYKSLVDDVNKAFDTYKETTETTISELKETDSSIKASVSDTKQAVADDVAALQAKLATVKQVAAKTQQVANDTVTKQTAALAAIATAKPKLTSSFVSGALTDAGWNTLKYLWEDAGSAYVADIDWADSVSVNHDAYTTAYKALQAFMQLHATTKPTESEASIEKLFNDVYGAETDLFATMVTKTADDATKMNKLAADTESALGDYANLDVTDYAAMEITAAKIANTVKEVQNGITTKFSKMEQTVDGFKFMVSDTEKTVTQYTDDAINKLTPYTHIAYANSADGKTDFSVSDSNLTYIGMYVDFTATDSTDPTKYAWSLIKGADGAQGTPGKAGADGKTPYFHIAYADNANGTEGFSTTDSLNKPYIGQYTDYVQADATDPTKYLWTLIKGDTGADGDVGPKGDQGLPGENGSDGKSSYTHIAYGTSNSGAGFTQTPSTSTTYIGMYVDFSSGDSKNPSDYNWSLIKGADGADGKDGVPGPKGTDGKTPYFHIAYADSIDGMTNFSLDTPGSRKYIGNYTDFTQADSTNPAAYSWQLVQGPKGDTGKDGIAGKDGVGIKSTQIMYAQSTSGTTPPTTGWTAQVPLLIKGQYLWTQTTWLYTDNTGESGYTVSYNAKDGNSGKDGIAGKDGVGINSTSIAYFVSSSGVTKPTTGWSATIPSIAPGQFLWTRTMWIYTDGTNEVGYSVSQAGETGPKGDKGVQGLQGPKGDQGIKGPDGADGISSYAHIAYANSADGKTDFSVSDPNRTYIGMYVDQIVTDSDDPTKYAWSLIKGADGANGAPGKAGADGKTPYFHQAWADSQDGTTNFSTTVSLGKKYLGTYTDYVAADSTDPTIYKWTELVGAIEIGGRNYFLNSKTRTITPHGTANFDWRINISDDFWSNSDRLKSNNIRVSFTLTAQKALTADFNSRLYFSATPWPSKAISYPAGTTAPKKYELVFNITDSSFKTDNCFIRFQAKDTSANPFVLENAKLEIGTTFTDWSPAPEDMVPKTDFNVLSDKISGIVTKDDIANGFTVTGDGVSLFGKTIQITGDMVTAGINASNITTGTISGANLSINLTTGEILFQRGAIKSTDGSFLIDVDKKTISSFSTGTYDSGLKIDQGSIKFYQHSRDKKPSSFVSMGNATNANMIISSKNGINIMANDDLFSGSHNPNRPNIVGQSIDFGPRRLDITVAPEYGQSGNTKYNYSSLNLRAWDTDNSHLASFELHSGNKNANGTSNYNTSITMGAENIFIGNTFAGISIDTYSQNTISLNGISLKKIDLIANTTVYGNLQVTGDINANGVHFINTAGVYFDQYGNIHGSPTSFDWNLIGFDQGKVASFPLNNKADINLNPPRGYGLKVNGTITTPWDVNCKRLTQTSLLSKKTNISTLDTATALSTINETGIYRYQFKSDIAAEGTTAKYHTSPIIDDVNTTPQYETPNQFISENKQGRDDGDILGYTVAAIQELSKQVDTLKQQLAVK